jgi:hypothetical protein
MNDIIVQQVLFWFGEPYHTSTIPTKGLAIITFNNIFSMKF